MYETTKIIYDSAIKTELINYEKDLKHMDYIISKLLAYKSVLLIRDIQLTKAGEEKKAKDKAEREGKIIPIVKKDPTHMTEEEIYAMKLEQ